MVRIVVRALATTLLTLAALGTIIATQADRTRDGLPEGRPAVVVLGDLPEPLPGLGAEAEDAAPAGGVPAMVAALRAYLGGEAAPEPVPDEPEGVRVNLGPPSGAGDVRVNRGLP